jgi:hypothetical protein
MTREELRLELLKLAAADREVPADAETVIANASKFEKYVTTPKARENSDSEPR